VLDVGQRKIDINNRQRRQALRTSVRSRAFCPLGATSFRRQPSTGDLPTHP
jgi:hypothetical protein